MTLKKVVKIDPQLHQQMKMNLIKNVLSKISHHIEINNACEVIKRFLEIKSNSDFNSFYKLENQLTDMMLLQKSKQTKISDYFTCKQVSKIVFNFLKC